ncbi:unnamed protein product, partial [Brachionus calyciflorus]
MQKNQNAFANIYEVILLTDLEKQHIDNHKQFGLKSKSSCSHAIFSLKQSIAKSIWEKKLLYVAAIDASKAFDKVNRNYLWQKLIIKKVGSHTISALKYYYDCSMMIVRKDNEYSTPFKTTVGVKQGGVISPKFFSIYIEDLITGIEKFEHGVKFGSAKVDIVAYADGILLLSQTRAGLRDQLSFVTD